MLLVGRVTGRASALYRVLLQQLLNVYFWGPAGLGVTTEKWACQTEAENSISSSSSGSVVAVVAWWLNG